jgi:hypothetical protein
VSLRKLELNGAGYTVSKEKPVSMCSSTIWNDITKLEQLTQNDYLGFNGDLRSTPLSFITDDFVRTAPPRLCSSCGQPGHTKRNCPTLIDSIGGERKNEKKEKKELLRKKEKLKKKKSPPHCSNCGIAGHNRLHCPEIIDDGERFSEVEEKVDAKLSNQKRTRTGSEDSGTERKKHAHLKIESADESSSESIDGKLESYNRMELEVIHNMKMNLLAKDRRQHSHKSL